METEYKKNILQNLCYTELVYGRINKKLRLNLPNDGIERLMIKVIDSSDSIEKIGKNWYISNNEYKVRVTVNSYTFRIITADQIL